MPGEPSTCIFHRQVLMLVWDKPMAPVSFPCKECWGQQWLWMAVATQWCSAARGWQLSACHCGHNLTPFTPGRNGWRLKSEF